MLDVVRITLYVFYKTAAFVGVVTNKSVIIQLNCHIQNAMILVGDNTKDMANTKG